jgi:Spy/CpxP family protein refolding chaperone
MSNRLIFAVCLVVATPLALAARVATAQDAPPAASAPDAQSAPAPAPGAGQPRHRDGDGRDWGPKRDWDRSGHRDHGHDRGMERGPGHDWGHDGEREDAMLPFGMWWKNPEVATRIGLSAEQQKRIEDQFLQSRVQLIHMHASLQEEQLMLRPLLDATPFDEAKAMEQIDKIADTRADLEKTNAKMLLNIRGVLTAEQWAKLRSGRHAMHRPGEGGDMGPQGAPRPN